jgi:ABC-2 type transport system permease protein
MRAATLIALKDLKTRVRDRSALVMGILVPLGLALIFNSIFSGVSGDSAAIELGVVNLDHGPVAQVFVQRVLKAVDRTGIIAVHAESTVAGARALVGKGTLNASIVIPTGFSQRVHSAQPAAMHVIGNADSPISSEIARSIAQQYAADLNRVRLSVATVAQIDGGSIATSRLRALAGRATAATSPLALRDVSAATKELDQKSFFSAGMAVFFLFFTVQFGVTSLLEERNDGTLARLLAAPISKGSILAGKLITSFLLGAISMSVLVVATSWLFGASWGDPLGVAILVVAAIMSAIGIMALIATLAKNAEQASNWQSVVAVVLGLLGGTFFPVSQAPGILSKLTFLAPQAWFIRGLGDLRGGGISVIWLPAVAMLVFAVVAGGIAIFRLRRIAEV